MLIYYWGHRLNMCNDASINKTGRGCIFGKISDQILSVSNIICIVICSVAQSLSATPVDTGSNWFYIRLLEDLWTSSDLIWTSYARSSYVLLTGFVFGRRYVQHVKYSKEYIWRDTNKPSPSKHVICKVINENAGLTSLTL